MNWQALLPAIGDFFSHHIYLGIFFSGFIAFIESLAVVGSIVPGSIFMSIIGFLLGFGILPLQPTLIAVFIGAFLGDYISYIIGSIYKHKFKELSWVQPYQHWVLHGERFMQKYGIFSILIGRFFGPMRSLIPLIAGLADMSLSRFTIAIIPTIILWAFVYLLPGALLAIVSMEVGENYMIQTISNICLYLVLFGLWHSLHIFIQTFNPLRNKFSFMSNENLTHLIKASTLLILTTTIVYYQACYPPNTSWINNAAYHYSLLHSSDLNIKIAQMISLSSSHLTYILANFAAILVLYYHHHKRFALIWLTLSSGLFGLTTLLKYTLLISRPNPILHTTGFPSGHLLLFTSLLLCLSILIEKNALIFSIVLRRLTFATFGLIAVSRLILQAHWFLDLTASACLALTIWHIASIFKHKIPRIPVAHLRQVGATMLLIIIPITTIYQQIPPEVRPNIPASLEINELESLNTLPRVRYSRLGTTIAPINFVYVGTYSDLTNFFNSEGFTEYPNSGTVYSRLSTLFHYSEYHDILPLMPPLLDNRGPDIIFGKTDHQHAFIAKIWHIPGHLGLYIGTVSVESYPESFFSAQLLICQKQRFDINKIFKDQRYFRKTPAITISQTKNEFCWNGQMFYKC